MSEMILSDGPNGATVLNWSSDITVVGMIASLAARASWASSLRK